MELHTEEQQPWSTEHSKTGPEKNRRQKTTVKDFWTQYRDTERPFFAPPSLNLQNPGCPISLKGYKSLLEDVCIL